MRDWHGTGGRLGLGLRLLLGKYPSDVFFGIDGAGGRSDILRLHKWERLPSASQIVAEPGDLAKPPDPT